MPIAAQSAGFRKRPANMRNPSRYTRLQSRLAYLLFRIASRSDAVAFDAADHRGEILIAQGAKRSV